jgi:hypothetical protein
MRIIVKSVLGAVMILLLATAANAAESLPLSGTWQLEIVSPQGTRMPLMTLTQTGTQVSGTYKSLRGDVPIGGTIQGSEFTLAVKIPSDGEPFTVQYKGHVDGASLTGRVMMGARGEASFTGKRVPPGATPGPAATPQVVSH